MSRETVRRFGLGDLLILVAAIAVAMLGLRNLWDGLATGKGASYWASTPVRLLIASALSLCATPLTIACLIFRVRRPRPAWRRVAIRPGTAAMIACLVVFSMQAVEVSASLGWPDVQKFGGFEVSRSSPIRFGQSDYLVLVRSTGGNGVIGRIEPVMCHGLLVASFAMPCGSAVAAVWMVQALSGRWAPEKSWIDRMGRFLGAAWILISLLAAVTVSPR